MVQNKWKKGNLEKAGSKKEEEGKERKMQQNISGKGNPGREHDQKRIITEWLISTVHMQGCCVRLSRERRENNR